MAVKGKSGQLYTEK